MPAAEPHLTRDAALRVARKVLRLRPLSESALRAALKAERLPLTVAQVADLLRDDGFLLGHDGRWRLAEGGETSARSIEWQAALPVAHLTYPQLAARLHVAEAKLRQLIPVLAQVHPGVDWRALDRRLRGGGSVAIRESTVEAAGVALGAYEAATRLRGSEPLHSDGSSWAPPSATFSGEGRDSANRDDAQAEHGGRLPALTERLEAELRAAQSEREAAAAARREAEEVKQNLVRERQAEIVQKAEQVRAADEARRDAVREERRGRRGKSDLAKAPPLKKTLLGWEETNAGWMYIAGSPTTEGEKELRRQLRDVTGLTLLNCQVWDGAKERELDAIVINPRGVVIIEQKDVAQRSGGRLAVPVNGPVTVNGHQVGHDQARHQARLGAQLLASVTKRTPVLDAGFITAFLAFHGDLEFEPELQRGNVRVVLTKSVSKCLNEYFYAREKAITSSVARELLRRVEVPALDESRVSKLGFLTH